MTQPQELQVWYLLPAIRKEMVISLKNYGLKQKDIAKKLDITEAAVSQYVKEKRASKINLQQEVKNMIRISAKNISEKGANVIEEIQRACNAAIKDKTLCQIHKEKGFDIRNCDICIK